MAPRATWRSHQLLGLIPQTITTDYIYKIRAFGTAPIVGPGNANITTRGFTYVETTAYGATTTPDNGSYGASSFTVSLTSLTCSTLYYVRSYGTNPSGTSYGNDVTFSTSACPTFPVVATPTVSTTTQTATFSSNITDIGIANPTIRGFEYGTSTSYGTIISSTSPSFGTGAFSQSINTSWLSCSTAYHYRAFTTNSAGSASSTDASFTTNSCNTLNSGLVGWWKFDDGGGISAVDSSGNGNTGTLIYSFPSDNSQWVTGQIGGALSFGAASASSTVLVNNALVSDSSDGSYSLWVYESDSSPNSSFQALLEAVRNTGGDCYDLYYNNGQITYMGDNGGGQLGGIYTYDLSSKWTHIGVTWTSTDAYLYINGNLVQSGPNNGCPGGIGNQFAIGNNVYNGYFPYYINNSVHGYLDDVRVYNRKLSDQEAYFLYKEGLNTWGNTPATNHAPIAIAGSNQTILLPATATLSGITTDDGLPVGSSITNTWSYVSGPAQAYFSATSSLNTLATFSTAGTYVLRLTASDSDLASSSDVTITVNPADTTPPVLSNSYPTYELPASTTRIDFSVTTDEKAVCKYGTNPGVAYASQPLSFDYDNGVTHRSLLTGLSSGNSYTYYVRCRDTAGNVNDSDYTVAFSIAQATTSSRTFYVATTGSSGGDGSITSPWDLATALESNLSHTRTGDIICLRGGIYQATVVSNLLGSTTGQITVESYPGEWAIVNGGIDQEGGGYVTYRDFEITEAYAPGLKRVSNQSVSTNWASVYR